MNVAALPMVARPNANSGGPAAWPVKNAMQKFRPEFEDYIQKKLTSQDPIRELVGTH